MTKREEFGLTFEKKKVVKVFLSFCGAGKEFSIGNSHKYFFVTHNCRQTTS
jgi:hypothetical protein